LRLDYIIGARFEVVQLTIDLNICAEQPTRRVIMPDANEANRHDVPCARLSARPRRKGLTVVPKANYLQKGHQYCLMALSFNSALSLINFKAICDIADSD